jgi:spore maturation protein CgeB
MRFVYFTHSLRSDWNHGNAHFLRGVASRLQQLGNTVDVYEPASAWSVQNLIADHGEQPLHAFAAAYPQLHSHVYDPHQFDLDEALDGADVVLVHEWNTPELVAEVGRRRARGSFRLLFHDTHHRAVTAPDEMARCQLDHYDGVLAFGAVIRNLYLDRGWTEHAWTWHEAADVERFVPLPNRPEHELVWIGNWGDEERTAELRDYLIRPARDLRLSTVVYGVRFPVSARQELDRAHIDYRGWLPNFLVPDAFSRARCTLHIPRRPYREQIPGVPTIRMFEALACGIPLISLHWDDQDQLFTAGEDYLSVRNPAEMRTRLREVLSDADLRKHLASRGLQTIRERHTCAHRVDELLAILQELAGAGTAASQSAPSEAEQEPNPDALARYVL